MTNRLRDLHFLVGDDDPGQRQGVVEVIAHRGFRVYTAGSGHEVLEILRSVPIDLTILDIHMPGFTGIEIVEMTRRAVWHDGRRFIGPAVIPAIFMSADITPELQVRCEETGSVLLPKPIQLRSMRAAIDRVLQEMN